MNCSVGPCGLTAAPEPGVPGGLGRAVKAAGTVLKTAEVIGYIFGIWDDLSTADEADRRGISPSDIYDEQAAKRGGLYRSGLLPGLVLDRCSYSPSACSEVQ